MNDVGKKDMTVALGAQFRALYHGLDPVAIAAMDEIPGTEPGMRITFASNVPDCVAIEAAGGDGEFRRCPDGVLAVRFDKAGGRQEHVVRVRARRADGSVMAEHQLTVTFQPKSDSPAQPNHHFGLRIAPPLSPMSGFLEDWRYPQPTAEEREFAARQWGPRLAGVEGDYAKAKVLAKALMEELWPHSGSPSPAMAPLQPFEQYARMVSGKDKGFCTHFSAIFDCACKSFGLLARRIAMVEAPIASHRALLLVGTNHTTTEVFDHALNQWVLMDLRFLMLGAFLGEEGPLTLSEFVQFLNQPSRRARVHLLVYDTEAKTERLLPLADCPRSGVECYEGWNRVFHYTRI